MKTFAALLCLAVLQDGVGPDLLEYEPAGKLNGEFDLGPCDGYERLIERWAARLKEHHPDVRGGLAASTSGATTKALISGSSRFGIMTRPWTDSEAEDFRFQWGFGPTSLAVAGDALLIVVHPDNPIRALSLEDVDAIFSSTRHRGGKDLRTWGQLGLQEEWKELPFHAYGLGEKHPAQSSFRSRVLQGGTFRDGVKTVADVPSLLSIVADDPCAIGYVSGAGRPEQARVVPLRPAADKAAVDPEPESILSLSYPLAWRISLAVRKRTKTTIDPDVGEFVKLILSRDGQAIVADEGLIPVTGRVARKELLKLK